MNEGGYGHSLQNGILMARCLKQMLRGQSHNWQRRTCSVSEPGSVLHGKCDGCGRLLSAGSQALEYRCDLLDKQ